MSAALTDVHSREKQPWNKQSWARRSPVFTNLVNTLKTKFS